jgi:hypothetical protein
MHDLPRTRSSDNIRSRTRSLGFECWRHLRVSTVLLIQVAFHVIVSLNSEPTESMAFGAVHHRRLPIRRQSILSQRSLQQVHAGDQGSPCLAEHLSLGPW